MTDYRWKVTEKDQALPEAPPPILTELQAGWLWVAATTIGLVLGMVFYTLTGGELLVGAIMIGLLMGWTQMLILTLQRVRVGWLWILNSLIAFVTWSMAAPVFGSINLWAGFALGVLLGFLQWLNLRRRVEHALWWVAANIAAWTIGLGIYVPVTQLSGTWLIGFAVAGVVAGSIVAVALIRLLRKPVFEVPAETPLKDDYQSS
jgi:hypothetical protein